VNFDRKIDRRGTWSLKWDNPKNVPGTPDILPFWVADMDFPPPPEVRAAIRTRARHPIFGYTRAPARYFELLAAWYGRRHGIVVDTECFLPAQAVMQSIGAAIRAFSREGEGVLVMPPVYYPFFEIARSNRRVIVEAPLSRDEGGRWVMDAARMERAVDEASLAGTKTRMIMLSSPHNPVARAWTKGELDVLLDFAEHRGITIVSDEIHGDIVFPPCRFVSLAGVTGQGASRIVVLAGPNKTFNLAGLHLSHVVARDPEVRSAMKRSFEASGFVSPNVFSITAAMAAYGSGSAWLDGLLGYLDGNLSFLRQRLNRDIPLAAVSPLEGTYLAWVDCSRLIERLGLNDDKALVARLEEAGRVKFSAGSDFGAGGEGHLRVNIACPRALLAEGLDRAAAVVSATT
jgi:cystathionine beta-lyase